MTTTSFSIQSRIPSNNKLLRMHWGSRKTLIDKWRGYVSMFGKIDPIQGHCKIRVVEIVPKGGRRLDEINLLAASDKLIIDAMVKLHILKNDSPRYLHVEAGSESGIYWGVRIEVTTDGSADTEVSRAGDQAPHLVPVRRKQQPTPSGKQ